MWVIIISMAFCFMNLVQNSDGSTFIFKKSYDIYDHANWDNHAPQQECDGLILPQFPLAVLSSRKLEIKNLAFGMEMTFFFDDDTDIIFDEDSNSIMNCIKLNDSEMVSHSWESPYNWILHGKEDNEAVPHLERLPCEFDDVILPKGILSGRISLEDAVTVKSFKFGNESWSTLDFMEQIHDELILSVLVLYYGVIDVRNRDCLDESGCPCGNKYAYRRVCSYIPPVTNFDCLNPIDAYGFCNKICGASILFAPSLYFKIKDIERRLQDYASDTHVSKVVDNDGDQVIQIIFTEKKFSGASLEEAQELHKILIDEKIIFPHNSKLIISGYYYKEGAKTRTTLSLVFGSLVGAGLVFALLFFVYSKEGRFGNVGERFGLGSGPLTYRSVFFSRNSVSEGAGLIMDGQSVAGSVQNIPKSFENAMFSGLKKSPSTSESSDSSEGETDTNKETGKPMTDGKTEPELFEDQERRGLIEAVAEEGELVDLSEMN